MYYLFVVNCWPSESASGCEVNIEYTLDAAEMQLNDVLIVIPLPLVFISVVIIIIVVSLLSPSVLQCQPVFICH